MQNFQFQKGNIGIKKPARNQQLLEYIEKDKDLRSMETSLDRGYMYT